MESIRDLSIMLDKLVFNGTIDNWRIFNKKEVGLDFLEDTNLVFILFFGSKTAIVIPPGENGVSSKRARKSITVGKVDIASKEISNTKRFYNTPTLLTNLSGYIESLKHM